MQKFGRGLQSLFIKKKVGTGTSSVTSSGTSSVTSSGTSSGSNGSAAMLDAKDLFKK